MEYDLILVGGGLANSLIAYRLSTTRPDLRLLLLERGERLGGNHTWSFHDSDLEPDQRRWMAPFVEHHWPGYEVRFPAYRRELRGGYASFTGARLHEVVSAILGESAVPNAAVASLQAESVVLEDGRVLRARAVVDGRGPVDDPDLVVRFQKFLGQVLELESAHGLETPIIMDATVAQHDGYRFLYSLPLDPRRVLVEDTRYSDTPEVDVADLRGQIRRYAESMGWRIRRVGREEIGVLPITLAGDIAKFWRRSNPGVTRSGLRAALFHPTTGYSLPHAVRLADDIGQVLPAQASTLFEFVRQRSVSAWRHERFFRMLNRMMFLAGTPDQRFRVLERFYRLPAPLISRFYAGRLGAADRLRLLSGAPPVPVVAALRAIAAGPETCRSAAAGARS